MRRGRRRCIIRAIALVASGASVVCSSASAVSFGLPLGTAPFNVAPSYPYDCSVVVNPFIGAVPLPGPNGGAASSCIWIHVPTPAEVQAAGGRNISLEPPGTGTVTQVRVDVGARTGPMQILVMRALYENTLTPGRPNDACCFPVARSQAFTPQANAITTVTVNLPVREDATPPPEDTTTIADFDTLGLAVLAPGVPVPLYYTGDASQPGDFVWNTSSPSTVTPGFSTDTGGFFVALGGEWSANGGRAPIDFGNGVEQVRRGAADVAMRCAGNVQCIGKLLLQSAAGNGARLTADVRTGRITAHRVTTYGSTSFKIRAGKRKTITVRLSSAGKELVAHKHTVKAWANVTLSSGASRRFTSRITLHR